MKMKNYLVMMMNKIQSIVTKMKYVLGLYTQEQDFPQPEDVLFEISKKNFDEFTPKQAMGCLDSKYKETIDDNKLIEILEGFVSEGIIIKRAKKYKFSEV